MSRPAARFGDLTAHGSPLSPSPGSPNVWIGGKPAWRGITAAQAAALAATFKQGLEDIAKAQANAAAVAGTPAAPAAQAKVLDTIKDAAMNMTKLMSSFAADQHGCPIVKVAVPDGIGVVIDGSQTVLINNLAACRMGDTIQEASSVNKIAVGEFSVLIGG
jgi:uncharacterized Zn-binding protein involved in type VI secretion